MNPTDQLIADARNHLELLNDAARKREGARLIDRLIARVRELEAERGGLTWTDAKPKVPGAYWVKDGGEEVVTIFEIEGELRVYVPGVRHSINLDEFCRRVGNRTLQFAGPIQPPTEAAP